MEIKVGAATDKGNIKEVNQDSLYFKVTGSEDGEIGLFVMSDGMGGLSHGEVASGMAVRAFRDWYNQEMPKLTSKSGNYEVMSSLSGVMYSVNKEIMEYGEKISEYVGTTTSALFLYNDNYYIVHIGDSRIYRITRTIEQLTEDHSLVAVSVKNNLITKEEAKAHPKRNVLTQCLGLKEYIDIHRVYGKLQGNELFVLCCDGFYNMLEDDEILSIRECRKKLSNEALSRHAEGMVNLIKSRGERDNITVIIVGVEKKAEGIFSRLHRR